MKYFAGIDIGSTASKVVVLDGTDMVDHFVLPTGWSSRETAGEIARRLEAGGHPVGEDMKVIAECIYRTAREDYLEHQEEIRAKVNELCGKYPLYE